MFREIPKTEEVIEDIERAAEEYGVSVSRIFRIADMPHTTFTGWKNGTYTPSLASLHKVYAALDEVRKQHEETQRL
jgi:predicted transcriptional regulator